ncbi:MAG: tetratricopeptide repeat protein [Massilia sp.]
MSQFRLARISLILAAIGLNAVPALAPAAFAQDKGSASAAAPETVRPELYKLLDSNKVKELLAAKKYADVQANITAAEAIDKLTPYEIYIIDRTKLNLGVASNDNDLTMKALEAVINTGRAGKNDNAEFMQVLGDRYFNAKNYAKAVEWYTRYQKEAPEPNKILNSLGKAYLLTNDYQNARVQFDALVRNAEAAGKVPDFTELDLLKVSYARLKDTDGYIATLEKIVTYHPTNENWTELLSRTQSKAGFNARLQLDAYRLKLAAQKEMTPEEYVDMTELALLGGFFTEAKNAMDAGFANGVLGKGSNAAKHKQLHDKATKSAADDEKNIASGEASAKAGKTGQPMVNLGYAFASMGQYDKGIDLIEKGIAKGGLKNPDDAKLHLGVAYAKAGRKADAQKVFEGIKGNDGLGDLSRLWVLYLNRKPMAAAAS